MFVYSVCSLQWLYRGEGGSEQSGDVPDVASEEQS